MFAKIRFELIIRMIWIKLLNKAITAELIRAACSITAVGSGT